jgi:predicted secreted protein
MCSVARNTGSMLVHAHDGCIDHLHHAIMSGGQRFHDLVPDASLPPANEAIVAARVWPIVLWQVAPRRTRTQDPEDAVEHATVIYTPNTARLVRQHLFDGSPFLITEFVAHDSKLRFGSLTHAPGGTIKPEGPIAANANALTLLPLLEHQQTWPDLPPVRAGRE